MRRCCSRFQLILKAHEKNYKEGKGGMGKHEMLEQFGTLQNGAKLDALVLVNCVATTAGWIEWGYQKVAVFIACLAVGGVLCEIGWEYVLILENTINVEVL
uniref:Uncharacterized protein n=1 Tax=Parascaris equorum TaxID=6256 RepID=A0A914S0U0_PAREQ